MKKLICGAMLIGFASLGYSQNTDSEKNTIHLTGVLVSPVDQNYLDNADGGVISERVKDLQRRASSYNIKESRFYDFNLDKGQTYKVSFRGDKGRILAIYDQSGKIINARENYKNLPLPPAVRNAAYKELPDWTLKGTKYSVNYDGKNASKKYQVQMKKNKEKENMKFNIDGKRIN